MRRKTIQRAKGVLFVLVVAALCGVVWVRSQRMAAGRSGLGRSFAFDMDRHLEVDPDLVIYDEGTPVVPDLDTTMSIAVGLDDRIYVGGEGVIVVLSHDGREQRRIDIEGGANCLAVDSDGTIFAGVGNHIEVFNPGGERVGLWEPAAGVSLPVSIVLRGDDVFVGEAQRGQVLRYNRDGVLVDSMLGFVLFSSPIFGMDVDSKDNLWVCNPGGRELRRYNRAGEIEVQWTRPGRSIDGFSGCCNPVDIALRPDGNIVTSEKNIVRVKVVSPEGELVGVVAGPRAFDQEIADLDVAVDSQGRVLVLDPVMKAVRVFEENREDD